MPVDILLYTPVPLLRAYNHSSSSVGAHTVLSSSSLSHCSIRITYSMKQFVFTVRIVLHISVFTHFGAREPETSESFQTDGRGRKWNVAITSDGEGHLLGDSIKNTSSLRGRVDDPEKPLGAPCRLKRIQPTSRSVRSDFISIPTGFVDPKACRASNVSRAQCIFRILITER